MYIYHYSFIKQYILYGFDCFETSAKITFKYLKNNHIHNKKN